MSRIAIKYHQVPAAIRWCRHNIGDTMYYLHNVTGGEAWRVLKTRNNCDTYYIEIDDEKAAVIFALSLKG
jgi:hypothetical protein